ncbi:MAG: hypothetical protein ABIY70_03530, partial [Capsulimonas sp.]
MNIIIWLIVVVAAYCAVGFWVANIMRSFRMGHKTKAGILLALPFVILILDMFLAAPLRVVAFVALLALGTVIAAKVLTPTEHVIPEREIKTSMLHLLLVSGSSLFLIPFFWMVITSLKEDSQMSHFPPEIIPTQQVMVKLNGKDAGLVWLDNNGKHVQGAVKETFPDGMEDIQILNGGPVVHISKADVTEVRHFAPVWKNYPDALKFLPADSNFGLVN